MNVPENVLWNLLEKGSEKQQVMAARMLGNKGLLDIDKINGIDDGEQPEKQRQYPQATGDDSWILDAKYF